MRLHTAVAHRQNDMRVSMRVCVCVCVYRLEEPLDSTLRTRLPVSEPAVISACASGANWAVGWAACSSFVYAVCVVSPLSTSNYLGRQPAQTFSLIANVFEWHSINSAAVTSSPPSPSATLWEVHKLQRAVHNSGTNCWQQLQIDKLINRLIGLQSFM